jgi:hypothetical protein
MANAIKKIIAKRKKKKTQANDRRDVKLIMCISDLRPIDSAFNNHGNLGSPNEEDTSSMSSFSTTATMDNNPGAGCTVDKYFYQPMGRRIEKLAMRIVMPILSPNRIFQYIEENNRDRPFLISLSFVGGHLTYHELSSVKLAGLSSLVSQTQ